MTENRITHDQEEKFSSHDMERKELAFLFIRCVSLQMGHPQTRQATTDCGSHGEAA